MECPLISLIQRVQLYETKARFYLIGSNSTETAFRVLKIDRTEPKELHIHDDKHVYNKVDILNLLDSLAAANAHISTKQRQQSDGQMGLLKRVSAYGIVGFVKFLEGYYMILITRRSVAAVIGGHTIYKIEDTVMQYIPNDWVRGKDPHPDEARYLKMFQAVDLSSNFYFSYSYDLTHTLQYNMSPSVSPAFHDDQENNSQDHVYGIRPQPEKKYVWNKYLTEPFTRDSYSDWVLHVIYGFIAQSNVYIFGKSVFVTLIARRSNQFAGPRFLKRGANSQGAVANEVETEQIVQDTSVTQLDKARLSSYVQMRGSIPIYWSQDIAKMVPKPAIVVDQRDPYFHTAGLHFNTCLYRYGSPVILFNLVKRHEKREHESLLRDEYIDCKAYLNQFLPPDKQMIYIGFDIARYTKKESNDVFERLARISRSCVRQTGFFLHVPNLRPGFWDQEEFRGINGVKTATGSKQTGVVRTNCVDCIDRTNTAQFAVGKCVLAYQLYALGVLPVPDLDFDTDCVTMLEELYEDQGNTVALQYGGSHLVHRIEGYRKIAPWKAHSVDIFQTLSRYYSNAFSDMEKQQAMNVFLGVFRPARHSTNIWDLTTDFYLHNPDTLGMRLTRKCYTMWCDPEIFDHLPLPYAEVCKLRQCLVQGMARDEEAVNLFMENYKPYTLTSLTKLAKDMEKVIRNYRPKVIYKNPSPFERRISSDRDSRKYRYKRNTMLPSQEFTRSISVKDSTASTGSNTSETEESEGSGSSVEGDALTSESDEDKLPQDCVNSPRHTQSAQNVYDLDLIRFEEDENTQDVYKRYVELGCADVTPVTDRHNHFSVKVEPLDEYWNDVYCVELPTVSKRSTEVYKQYVQCGMHGASEPTRANTDIYRTYVKQMYM